jgi:hypothetical protein
MSVWKTLSEAVEQPAPGTFVWVRRSGGTVTAGEVWDDGSVATIGSDDTSYIIGTPEAEKFKKLAYARPEDFVEFIGVIEQPPK